VASPLTMVIAQKFIPVEVNLMDRANVQRLIVVHLLQLWVPFFNFVTFALGVRFSWCSVSGLTYMSSTRPISTRRSK
jgi:hypothetical protein